MKLRSRLLLLLLPVLAGVVVWLAHSGPEPAYQGKPLSQWIAQIKLGSSNRMAHLGPVKADREAIKAMGLAALPALLESVRPPGYEVWWQAFYREHYPDLPPALGVHLPSPSWPPNEIRDGAFNNFVADSCRSLRPQANSLLVKTLRHSRPEVRAVAVQALTWRTNATSPEVFAGLANCLRDPAVEVRRKAIQAVFGFGPAASNAVPAIVWTLLQSHSFDPTGTERAGAATALGKIGSGAVAAVPVLQEGIAQRTNSIFRVESAIALWNIRQQSADAFPALLQEFDAFYPSMKWEIVNCFGEMGSAAGAAVPRLVAFFNSMSDPNDGFAYYNRHQTVEALEKIAPDVAKKLAGEVAEPPQ